MYHAFRPCAAALAVATAFPAWAADPGATVLETVVVTAPAMNKPLSVSFDPKAPQQPLPANDGASFLKTIPGMSVIRKGGTDGDPVFRGMAASRLNILLDGENILGGCGGRMDPPTAYVFPETFDRVTLLKGPQTVLYGPGNSAGTVLFEKKPLYFADPAWRFNGSLMAGSFGRHDEVLDLQAGRSFGYLRASATHSHSDDYQDGDGNKVHSRYNRWNTSAAFGLTPDKDTRLEFSAVRSDAEAAYADRSMDGKKFARENYALKFDKKNISPVVEKIEAQAYYNYIDHVMDNYSLRAQVGNKMVSNPDRETVGGRLAITLRPTEVLRLVVGADTQTNQHTLRSTMNQDTTPYQNSPRLDDARFANTGLFGEATGFLSERDRIVAGLRVDDWKAKDQRSSGAWVSRGQTRSDTLTSGFGRYERDYGGDSTFYAGLGHAERFPDYWELISQNKQSVASNTAFYTKAEKTTQLDVGTIHQAGPWTVSVSGFYSRIDDFILIENGVRLRGTNNLTIVRNIDATTWGGEAGVAYALSPQWRADASLAYVRGSNDTDNRVLGQIPPLEARLGLTWDNKVWTVGSLWRLVAGQHRSAEAELANGTNAVGHGGQGNIVGQDLGRTGGFGVFSLNAGYRPGKGVLFSAGVDNLFDKKYAEHLSKGGAANMATMAAIGYPTLFRVNEPGRTLWLKAQIALD